MTRPAAVATVFLFTFGAACGDGSPTAPSDLVAAISLSAPPGLDVGQTFAMRVTAVDASGEPVAPPAAAWSSSDPSVASITSAGVVTGVAPGEATITAKVEELEASTVVEVTPGTVTGLLIQAPQALSAGVTISLTVAGINSWGAEVPGPPVAWSSSNPEVARITLGGTVSGLLSGETTILATTGMLTATTQLSITPVPANLDLAVLPPGEFGDTIVLAPGQPIQLSAWLYQNAPQPGASRFTTAAAVTWTSTDPHVATVSGDGLVMANASGTTNIRASVDQRSVTTPIQVTSVAGSIRVRFIHAATVLAPLAVRPSTGAPVPLEFGESREVTLPAGTLQASVDGYALHVPESFDPAIFQVQQFSGFLPANTHATLVVVSNPAFATLTGPVNIVPLWDQTEPLAPGSVRVRVVLATGGGYNVYFAPPGAPMGTLFLQGCYLDWPYGVTDYADRPAGTFDIVLEAKGRPGIEVARHRVTPDPGKGTTYILTGEAASLQVLTFVDP